MLDAVVEAVPAILFAKDAATGCFVLVNRAAESMLGFTREEMLGRTVHDLFPKAQADFFAEVDRRAVESDGSPIIEEEEVTTGGGEVRWVRTKKIIVPGAKGARYLLGVSEDITEAKATGEALRWALERAEDANRAKSEFLTTMSHEIRTPLNGVLGMAQAMEGDDLSERQRARLAIIQESGEALLAILNDILDLAKIEAGKLELELTDFDLDVLCRGAAAAFAPLAEQKGVSFSFAIEDSARAIFNGDGTRLRRLLYNLLSNAVKFTDAGHIDVTVAYEDGVLRVEVADTGIGIPPDQLANLFEKFVQGDASYTRRFGGSGLGLSICLGIAQIMGGSIKVASTVGEGSVFTAHLPLPRSSHSAMAAPGAAAYRPLTGRAQAAPKVLVAEDNPVNQLVMRVLLEQAGIDPVMVENGAQALDAWEREHWDLMLMDIQMPVMDGVAATRAIRVREKATGRTRTPIIAVTANVMINQVQAYHAEGMDGVVPKPLDAAQLFAVLGGALNCGSWSPLLAAPA